ncbi:alpha-ketoglutarate-dependent dioxygenase AlkB family protein [Marinobacterium mangrovicola]|uniref:DNA-N1-methyladenine dioxygenase n=1 Tax=Marinobacterium mangrovicola TaxID=1476959 RepID=A0A4R1GP23_9GAMM|nr:alpha-ketoglutarate-dependent dioxygenase AlkB [Marinobacterium mangrovicola]TCK08705.1 DNA-N1-methyladenine dioxygenase [Marinobacterium mangrovicola]
MSTKRPVYPPFSPLNELNVITDFFSPEESQKLYTQLLEENAWPDNHYQVDGRIFELPRQQTWHADPGIRYSYSNNLLQTRPWTPLLQSLRQRVERAAGARFNSVLVNLYRTGDDCVGWHADDEPELGQAPLIASLTLGASRTFAWQHRDSREEGCMMLHSGTLLLMRPGFQHHWFHCIPRDPDIREGRINLTFRKVIPQE